LPVGNLKCVTSPIPIREGCVHIFYLAPGTSLGPAVSDVAPMFSLNKDSVQRCISCSGCTALRECDREYWAFEVGTESVSDGKSLCRILGNESALMD
jgi:hypothetical protein